jgi:hypothetical protein
MTGKDTHLDDVKSNSSQTVLSVIIVVPTPVSNIRLNGLFSFKMTDTTMRLL